MIEDEKKLIMKLKELKDKKNTLVENMKKSGVSNGVDGILEVIINSIKEIK